MAVSNSLQVFDAIELDNFQHQQILQFGIYNFYDIINGDELYRSIHSQIVDVEM